MLSRSWVTWGGKGMNRIDEVLERIRQNGDTAFIPFLTVGDPDLDTTVEIIAQLEKNGADLVELGVPYSDPLADGPVIQRASGRALTHQITILECMKAATLARQSGVKMPFILFTYYNPALQLGLERFFELLTENGISGVIIPDLPYEEDEEVRQLSVKHDIHLIPLVAPTSNERVKMIASRAKGFVYCVSSLGVTGERSEFFSGIDQFLETVRSATTIPIAVGFGISNHEQFQAFSKRVDGVIVGSAIVRKIEELLPSLKDPTSKSSALQEFGQFVARFKG
jgi:tryptophan synthase alpha chain